MKLLSAEEMQEVDRAVISSGAIAAERLMDQAGRAIFKLIQALFPAELAQGVIILCGKGNNAGDGFVVARLCAESGIPVQVIAAQQVSAYRNEAKLHAEKAALAGVTISPLGTAEFNPHQSKAGLIVDAILGTGSANAPSAEILALILLANKLANAGHLCIAVDQPSGIDATTGAVLGEVVKADITITLQTPKIGLLLDPARKYVGKLFCVDIGIPERLLSDFPLECLITEEAIALAKSCYPLTADAHKGTRGHVLVIGGSSGKYGAPKLTGLAAHRCGAGLVTLGLNHEGLLGVQHGVLEMMCLEIKPSELTEVLTNKDAIVLGPGFGSATWQSNIVLESIQILRAKNIPTVLDADALNILAANAAELKQLGPNFILTPHPGEISRLLEKPIAEIQVRRIESAQRLAELTGSVVVLKGARTVVAAPNGQTSLDCHEEPDLGTAGSGDVLSGILGALLARGIQSLPAAKLGAFIHGETAQQLREEKGYSLGLIAREIADASPRVIDRLLCQQEVKPEAICIFPRA